MGHGPPLGSQNARKHGLFAASLGPAGQAALDEARTLAPEDLARQAAEFAAAKIAEVFAAPPEVKGAVAMIDLYLDGLVQAKQLSFDAKMYLMRRLAEPDIASLGKALGPLKGLLEVKPRDGAIPAEDYARMMEDVADAVVQAAEETVDDEAVRAKLLEGIEARWARVQHQPAGRRPRQGA